MDLFAAQRRRGATTPREWKSRNTQANGEVFEGVGGAGRNRRP